MLLVWFYIKLSRTIHYCSINNLKMPGKLDIAACQACNGSPGSPAKPAGHLSTMSPLFAKQTNKNVSHTTYFLLQICDFEASSIRSH